MKTKLYLAAYYERFVLKRAEDSTQIKAWVKLLWQILMELKKDGFKDLVAESLIHNNSLTYSI